MCFEMINIISLGLRLAACDKNYIIVITENSFMRL